MENRDGGGQVAVAVLKDFVGLLASSSSSSSYNSSHYDHHCEHGHSIFEAVDYGFDVTLFCVIIIFLVLLTIGIEKGTDFLEEYANDFHLYSELLHHVIKELMNLGITGFILTCVEIFVHVESSQLHVIEIAHFVLLAFGFNYIMHTLILYKLVKRAPAKLEKVQAGIWRKTNDFLDPRKKTRSRLVSGANSLKKMLSKQEIELYYIAEFFRKRRPNIEQRNFTIVQYIRQAMEHEMLNLIHIKNATWAFAIIACALCIAADQIWRTFCGNDCGRRKDILISFVVVFNVVIFVLNPLLYCEANRVKKRIIDVQKDSGLSNATKKRESIQSFHKMFQARGSLKQYRSNKLNPSPTILEGSPGEEVKLSTLPHARTMSHGGNRHGTRFNGHPGHHKSKSAESKLTKAHVVVNLRAETGGLDLSTLWFCNAELVSSCIETMLFMQCIYIGLVVLIFAREATVLLHSAWGVISILAMFLPCFTFLFYFIPLILEPYFLMHAITAGDDFIDKCLAETILAGTRDEQIIKAVRDELKKVFEEFGDKKLIEVVMHAYHQIDVEGDGIITPKKLKYWMRKKGLYESISKRNFKHLWKILDEARNGSITVDDFVRVILLGGSHDKSQKLMMEMKMGKVVKSSSILFAMHSTKKQKHRNSISPSVWGSFGIGDRERKRMSRAAKVDFAKSSEKLIPDESSSVELIPVVGGKSAGGVTRADSGGRLSAIANATPNGDGDGMQRGSRRGTKEKNSKTPSKEMHKEIKKMNGMPGVGVSLSIGDMQSSHLSSPRDVGAPFSPLSDNSESQNGGQIPTGDRFLA